MTVSGVTQYLVSCAVQCQPLESYEVTHFIILQMGQLKLRVDDQGHGGQCGPLSEWSQGAG